MDKKRSFFLAGVLALACMATGAALINENVSANADGTGFEMISGASIRIADDGKYGIRYTASLGITSEDAIASTYGADSTFHVMIIPKVYYEDYLAELAAGADYYQTLYNALYNEQTNPEPYIATMKAEPFLPSATQTQLAQGVYHVQGSLTSLQYNNLNRDFIGLAYYQYEEGEGDEAVTKRVYAELPESGVSGLARDIVNVASKALNAGEYADGSDEDNVLDGFIRQGINQAKGVSAENKDQSVDTELTAISVPTSKKTLYKAEMKLTAENLPANVDIAVEWKAADEQTVIDADKAENGVVAPSKFGETTMTAKILGKTYTTTVKSLKANDWKFDIDAEYANYYDFTSTTVSSAEDAPEEVTGDIFSRTSNSTTISDGTLKIKFNGDPSAAGVTFAVENLLDSSYVEGNYVYTQMRMKVVNDSGTQVAWGNLQIFPFIASIDWGVLLSGTGTTRENKTFTISNADSEGYKTLTWYTPLSDYYQSWMYESENTADGFYAKTPWVFQLLPWAGGFANTTLVIDWIKADTVATKVDQTFDLATSTTYGGKTNAINTTATFDTPYVLAGEATEVANLVEGEITAGAKAGTASFTVNGSTDDSISYGSVTANVSTAISSKFDLDMLALAYARNTYTTDWAATASYVLTNDIDYNGDLFIPIAANTRGIDGATYYNVIGKQWSTILADGNEYGISYADFKTRGLNGYAWTRSELYTQADQTMFFNATLNGNGYAIKNPKLMFDAVVSNATHNFSMSSHIIGLLGSNSVIKNISIENVTLQTYKDAGYGDWIPLNAVEKDGIVCCANNYYSFTGFGVFGMGAGTLENVYAEWNAYFDNVYGMAWINANKFGRWEASTKMTDCIFVDNQTAVAEKDVADIHLITIEGTTLTADNVVVISAQSVSGSTLSGTLTVYASVEALESAYDTNNALFDGYEDWTITVEGGVLTAKLK